MLTSLQFLERNKILVTLIGGAVLGLLLGLAIGWWWWPVTLTNATPANLRSDFQSEYLLWVAEEYGENDDLELARRRLGTEFWEDEALAETLAQLEQDVSGQEASMVQKLAQDLEAVPEEIPEGEGIPLRTGALICGVALLVIASIGGALLLITRMRESKMEAEIKERAPSVSREVVPTERDVDETGQPPLAQFVATYSLGDDYFDPSFSIETEKGEFMGECGVGISETIGVGEPDKVTALEAWLFDKNDIRTVTKVLMSEYAFHDEALRDKLAPKGEPVLAEAGKDVILETRVLRLRARIVEVEYGKGNLPSQSYFEQMTIELAAWVKPDADTSSPPPVPEVPAESAA